MPSPPGPTTRFSHVNSNPLIAGAARSVAEGRSFRPHALMVTMPDMSERKPNWTNLLLLEVLMLGSGSLMLWLASGMHNERLLHIIGGVLILLGLFVLVKKLVAFRL
jgi:hypothetical protein